MKKNSNMTEREIKSFCEKLKSLRIKKELSQKEFCRQNGILPPVYNNLENGNLEGISMEKIRYICEKMEFENWNIYLGIFSEKTERCIKFISKRKGEKYLNIILSRIIKKIQEEK